MNTAWRGILLGGFFAGLADWIYPTVRTVMSGGSWMRPWKGVAGGLVGQAGRDGGLGMVALGTSLHFFICMVAAAVLYFVVSRLKFLPRNWLLLAVIHGIAVLLTMNYIILPLSAIGRGHLCVEPAAHPRVLSHPARGRADRVLRLARLEEGGVR